MYWLLILVIAALMGMGVGGGGLLVLALVWLFDVPQRTAQGINLAAFVVSAASSMLIHLRRRRVDLHLLWGALPGCLGAFFGARLAARLPSATLRILLGGLLTVAGVVGLIGALRGKRGENGRKTKK